MRLPFASASLTKSVDHVSLDRGAAPFGLFRWLLDDARTDTFLAGVAPGIAGNFSCSWDHCLRLRAIGRLKVALAHFGMRYKAWVRDRKMSDSAFLTKL